MQARLFAIARRASDPASCRSATSTSARSCRSTAGVGTRSTSATSCIEPGALVSYTPVPWEVENADRRPGTAGLSGLMANLGAGMEFLPRLSGRADAGLGALIFSGLTETGNPFLDVNDFADGPIAMFNVRGALGAEYAITDNFVIHAEPLVFSCSPSRPLRDGHRVDHPFRDAGRSRLQDVA